MKYCEPEGNLLFAGRRIMHSERVGGMSPLIVGTYRTSAVLSHTRFVRSAARRRRSLLGVPIASFYCQLPLATSPHSIYTNVALISATECLQSR